VVDDLTGKKLGRASSGTFRTADVVGLDTMAHVIRTLQDNLGPGKTEDPFSGMYGTPPVLAALLEAKSLGQKTGAGFYKKVGRDILRLDPESMEYVPGGAKADKNDVEAAKPLEMMGEKGDLLSRIKDMLNPAQIEQTVTRSLDRLLTSANVPERIRERLGGVAKSAVGELVSAVKEGRRPNFKKIKGMEELITTAVESGVNAVFKRIENAPAVKNSKFLSGLVKEAKGVSTTAATYGVLSAAGLHEGLAKDPFWSVIRNRHGESVKAFLRENGLASATQVVNGFVDRLGNIPLLEKNPKLRDKIVGFLTQAAERGVNQGVDRVLGLIPSGT